MSVDGKDGGHAIEVCAKISSICAGARSSTICMSWLVLSQDKLSFRSLLDFLTGSLGADIALLAPGLEIIRNVLDFTAELWSLQNERGEHDGRQERDE